MKPKPKEQKDCNAPDSSERSPRSLGCRRSEKGCVVLFVAFAITYTRRCDVRIDSAISDATKYIAAIDGRNESSNPQSCYHPSCNKPCVAEALRRSSAIWATLC